ncbi:MAG: aminotransferase class I/II-fold pyridoxal phosphate-dependent enzyme [Thermoanaerobaculia bacterium]
MTDRPSRRIYLSPPHMSGREQEYVADAFATNWIAPTGPHVDAFEREFAAKIGMKEAVAVSSGTAALHLALRILGIGPGDEVLCSTLTFAASANPIVYERATPVFIDSEERSWNIDPSLVAQELDDCARRGKLPTAVIAVDLYGQCADLDPIREVCTHHGVTLIEDAAEALGATYKGRSAGTFGLANVFSFNGNKIITTAGGGMLATDDVELARKARFLSQQAKDPAPHYEHSQIGFNYRASNVLAGIGRAQLEVLDERVAARRRIFDHYRNALSNVPGITFMPEADWGHSNRWLTCIQIDPEIFGTETEEVRLHLETQNIESRPVWKPLHLQPVFSQYRVVGGAIAERIFERGLCLPSGSAMSDDDLAFVVETFRSVPRHSGTRN